MSREIIDTARFAQELDRVGVEGGKKAQERAAGAVVEMAIERCDWLSVVLVVDRALDLIMDKETADVGKVMMTGIEGHFSELEMQPVVHKLLVPLDVDRREAFDQLAEAVISVTERLEDPVVARKELELGRTKRFIGKMSRVALVSREPVVGINLAIDPMERLEAEKEIRARTQLVHEAFGEEGRDDIGVRVKAVEKLMSKLRENDSGMAAINQEYGGWTLAQLMEEDGMDTFCLGVLDYMNDIPRGDIFWQLIVGEVLWFPPMVSSQVPMVDMFEDREMMTKFYNLNRWMGWNLLLPAISDYEVTQGFDERFAVLVNRWDENLVWEILVNVVATAWNELEVVAFLDGSVSWEEVASDFESCPFWRLASESVRRGEAGIATILADRQVHDFLEMNFDLIADNLRGRLRGDFVDRRKLGWFLEELKSLVEKDFGQVHTLEFAERTRASMGEAFFAKMEEELGQVTELTGAIWADIRETGLEWWPHPMVAHKIFFEQDAEEWSLPSVLGWESITFAVGEGLNAPVGFIVNMQGELMDIVGRLEEGRVRELSVDIESELPGLMALVELVVVAAFHDLVVRREKVGERGGERRVRMEEGVEVSEAGDVVEDIYGEESARGFKPRFVSTHRRRLGSYELINSIENFVRDWSGLSPKEMEARRGEWSRLIGSLNHISPEKAEHVPPGMRLTVNNPYTDEEVYIRTWVGGHFSPRIDLEEGSISLRDLLVRYYPKGAVLEMINVLEVWARGGEIQDAFEAEQ